MRISAQRLVVWQQVRSVRIVLNNMKIICFSSYTATWYFAIAEAAIASALQKKGHKVLYITPGDQFAGISSLSNERILRKKFNLKGYEIGPELSNKDYKEISSIMRRLNKYNFDKLVVDHIKIGKIALYEFLINRKKMDTDFSPSEWKKCLFYIKNTLISLYACRTILKNESPDRVLMYSTLYSVNHAWEEYAKKISIPVYFLHHGVNFSDIDNTLIIAKNNSLFYMAKLRQYWLKLRNIPVDQKMLSYVTKHFLELLRAKHSLVYSAPKSKGIVNIRKIFKIRENQKILVATMSSYDEMFASDYVGASNIPEKLIFRNQTDWIRELIKFVKDKKDHFLLIRVHPREFPNKRERVKSQHAKILEKILKNLPDNVKVNWPSENVSIYDLAQETDIFLNAWSTVGVEMSLLGIPVVIYSSDLIHYPSDLNYLSKNRRDYFAKIELALREGWSYNKIKKTYRWLTLNYCRPILRFRNTNSKSNPGILKHYYYQFLSLTVNIYTKFFGTSPGFTIEPRLLEDCDSQLSERIDITPLEEMLSKSGDTLVNIKEALSSNVTNKKEDMYMRGQIKYIYRALYGNISKSREIKKNSLQYNLRKVFI